jgi:hypothetical protein
MAVEQIPTLFGLPEGPEFSSILASMFFVWYWLSLADFGLTGDKCFDSGSISSNPFANQTLFDMYNTFMNDVATPFIFGNDSSQLQISATPINGTFRLQNSPLSFLQTYTCSQRQLKGWLSLFISVISSDVALTLGAYQFFIFVASYIQKRLDRKRNDFTRMQLTGGIGIPSDVELFALIDNYQRFQPRLFMLENNEILKPIQEQCTITATQATSAQIHCSLHE